MLKVLFPSSITFLVLGFLSGSPLHAQVPATNAPAATDASSEKTDAKPEDTVDTLLTDAHALLDKGDTDLAIAKINAALQIDPKNARGYVLRASVYGTQRLWDRAEKDYETALATGTAPNPTIIKFNLAELQFQQRKFGFARPGFVALQNDKELGDLVSYKIYLCDLMESHTADADKELAAFNKAGTNPSYYYSNAAYDLAHNKLADGRGWLESASHIYAKYKNDLYMASLLELGHVDDPVVSFKAKNGKAYTQVQVSVEGDGLHVLTPDGPVTLPFDQLPDDQSVFPPALRSRIEARRAPAPGATGFQVASLADKQGEKYENVTVFVEDTGLRFHAASGWVGIPFNELPDDLSSLPDDLQKLIAISRQPAPAAPGIKVDRLVTKDGGHYENVNVVVEDTDLRIHTPTGWSSVLLTQLPDDLSSLPQDLQQQIAIRRNSISNATTGTPVEHLVTTTGQTYDHVSVFLESTDLRVRTATGFVTIPFEQLPDDLSFLPSDLQKQINARKHPVSTAATGDVVSSLTTTSGKTYTNAEVFVEDTGLRLKTAAGFVNVPFEEVPADLSSFPTDLQRQIAAKRPHVSDVVSGIKLASLTTKSGQTYTDVAVFVENEGLRLKTKAGWITVPFDQLPKDQSNFPDELRKQITAKQPAVSP